MRNLAYWISRCRDFTASSTGLFPLVNWRGVFLREKLWGCRRLLRELNLIWNCSYFLNGVQRLQWLFRDMLCSRKLICLIVKNSSAFSSTLSLSRCDHATLFLSKVCYRVSINECEQTLGGRGCISRLNAGSRRWGDPWDPCKTVFKS